MALNENDVQAMTSRLREGLVARLPEVVLDGEVEIDEVYVVAGHKGNPAAVQKNTSGKVHWPDGIRKIALPPYSPELNPAERWFEALRRIFANAIFDTLEDLEAALTEALRPYWQNPTKLQRLVGYPWWCHAVAGVNSNSTPSERK